jgi:hypothetical protein
MVEHIGFDAQATNADDGGKLANPPLKPCPPIPSEWPRPVEHPQCPKLAWRFYDLPTDGPAPASDGLARLKRGIKRAVAAAVGDPTIQGMNCKEFVKLFIPPVAVRPFRRLCAGIKGTGAAASPALRRPEWEYIPEGWAYARTHPEVKGWNVQDVLEIYKQKWPRFVAMVQGTGPLGVAHESDLATNADINSHNTVMAFAYALALAAHHKDTLSILDWGGGIGHYYLLAQALLPDVRIEYHCKDVPLLAEYGAKLFPTSTSTPTSLVWSAPTISCWRAHRCTTARTGSGYWRGSQRRRVNTSTSPACRPWCRRPRVTCSKGNNHSQGPQGPSKCLIEYPRLLNGTYKSPAWFGDGREDFFCAKDCLSIEIVDVTRPKPVPATPVGPVVPKRQWYFS